MQMKLVIELTDKMHQAVKDGTWCGNELWYNALKNATPLEKVLEGIKAKIEAKAKEHRFYMDSGHPYDGLYEALEIIDKHISGKEQE